MRAAQSVFGAILLVTSVPAAAAADAGTAFGWIQGLVGEWEGEFEWSGERSGSGPIQARYRLTGRGSTVFEDHFYGGSEPLMSSAYHLDGSDLRMTHFCGAANQPRLRASAIDLDTRTISFAFVDITNLRAPEAGHVHSVELAFPAEDRLVVKFGYLEGDKRSEEIIRLRRVGGT